MFVRVVRFTDVNAERAAGMLARIEGSEGPPAGVRASRIQVLLDEQQDTAVVLQHFDSEQDMRDAGRAFGAMDPSETPGTRSSVDMCEVRLDRRMPG